MTTGPELLSGTPTSIGVPSRAGPTNMVKPSSGSKTRMGFRMA